MMSELSAMILGFFIGCIVVIVSVPNNINYGDIKDLSKEIIKCEETLPRNKYCIPSAIVSDKLIADE